MFIPEKHPPNGMTREEKATFAAGCFWGVEAAFRQVKGVIATRVGYTGGRTEHPTYEEVCSGKTGHAEAVEVVFDAGIVSYRELLDLFWSIHDPTQLNRQGPDYGTNYRSAIFYHSDEQKSLAEESRKKIGESGRYGRRQIVTEIVPATPFYAAEDYHQQFYEKQGKKSCRIW
jgi:peptide-methionine (S)-S-oxide reductase